MTRKTDQAGAANNERRRAARAASGLGQARLHLNANWARDYQVANLSAGGALLIGGPRVRIGRRVEVVLALAGRTPIDVAAEVVRDDPRHGMVAVRFVGLEAELEDEIQQAVLCALDGQLPALVNETQHEALPPDDEAPEEEVPTSWPGFALRQQHPARSTQLTDS